MFSIYRFVHFLESILLRRSNCSEAHLLNEEEVNSITTEARLLLGSYFTMEYSIEAAALFNPSIVEDPDQSDTIEGELKVQSNRGKSYFLCYF